MGVSLIVNGRRHDTESTGTLLDYLRAQGLTGAKEGCAEGECGACTVAMAGDGRYVAVNSCLLLVPQCAGREFLTVEGVRHSPVQDALVANAASQCGYCTPGFVMSLFCDPAAPSGNLCRCTGYRPIADAARSLGPAERPGKPAAALDAIDAPTFARPATLAGALDLLAARPDARLIAGGTDLVVDSNLRQRRYPFLLSVEAVPELRVYRELPAVIEIGAARPLSEIDVPHPVWREWSELFASPLIRNRATLGGNLATASPIGDAAPLLLALDARLRLASARGERTVPLSGFFLDYRKTALEPGELIRSVLIPKPLPEVARFYKASKRRLDDISTVAAAIAIHADGSIRIAYGGVAATPVLFRVRDLDEARQVIAPSLRPIGDHRGSAAYRLALAQSLVEKFRWEIAA
jgi:xanthine dehydrogenase small subunit